MYILCNVMNIKSIFLVLFFASLVWGQTPTVILAHESDGVRGAETFYEILIAEIFKGFIEIPEMQGPDWLRHATSKDSVAMVIFYEVTDVLGSGNFFIFDVVAGVYRKGQGPCEILFQTKRTFGIDFSNTIETNQTMLNMHKQLGEFLYEYKLCK